MYSLEMYSLVPGKAMAAINLVFHNQESKSALPLRWLPPVGLPPQLNYSPNRRHEEECFLTTLVRLTLKIHYHSAEALHSPPVRLQCSVPIQYVE